MWVAIVALVLILSFAACEEEEVKKVKKYVPIPANPVTYDLDCGIDWTYFGELDYTVKVKGQVKNIGASGLVNITSSIRSGFQFYTQTKWVYFRKGQEKTITFLFPEAELTFEKWRITMNARGVK